MPTTDRTADDVRRLGPSGSPGAPRRVTRMARLLLTAVTLAAVVGAGTYVVARTPVGPALGLDVGPPCRLDTAAGDRSWSRAEAMTATTTAAVGTRIGATENGVAAAVERGLAATGDQPLGPAAARQVYRGLPDRARPSAASLATARALLGVDGGALRCTVAALDPGGELAPESLGAGGLTPRAESVRGELRTAFGRQSLGGFAPGGVSTGHVEGSAHYDGRAIDVFFRPVTAAGTRRGWQVAQWAVAHAERLHVATVIFDREIWSARRSASGWRDYAYPGGPTDNPVLLHEDHVHVDVLRGDATG